MKRDDLLLILAVLCFSFLFYYELPGVNYLIFTVVLIGLLLIKNHNVIREPRWIAAAVGALISAFFVMKNASTISIIGNLIALGLLSCFSVNRRSSVFVGLAFSIYSIVSSMVYMIVDLVNRIDQIRKDPNKGKATLVKPLLVIIPLLIAVIFFVMYQEGSPAFNELTKEIKLDFLTPDWVVFTLWGFIMMYGFLYHRNFEPVKSFDANTPDRLKVDDVSDSFWDKLMSIVNENFSGLVLLTLLNLLILTVNISDIMFLSGGMELPDDVSRSDSVHQGVASLITSIVFAISIIMYYFRGRMNFYKGNVAIRVLGFIWIIQNVFMVFSTAMRNSDYVLAHGLTEKRIGVYVWLLLTLIGLVITLIKIWKKRSNWFMVRNSGWAFFAVLILSTGVSWGELISDYNIQAHEQRGVPVDAEYLALLDFVVIPDLVELYKDNEELRSNNFGYRLREQIADFKYNWEGTSWRSWNSEGQRVYDYLVASGSDPLYEEAYQQMEEATYDGWWW